MKGAGAAHDALAAMLEKKGMPSELARQAAFQVLSKLGLSAYGAGRRGLQLLNFQFMAEVVDGQYWIDRDQFERALSTIGVDPPLAENFPTV